MMIKQRLKIKSKSKTRKGKNTILFWINVLEWHETTNELWVHTTFGIDRWIQDKTTKCCYKINIS